MLREFRVRGFVQREALNSRDKSLLAMAQLIKEATTGGELTTTDRSLPTTTVPDWQRRLANLGYMTTLLTRFPTTFCSTSCLAKYIFPLLQATRCFPRIPN